MSEVSYKRYQNIRKQDQQNVPVLWLFLFLIEKNVSFTVKKKPVFTVILPFTKILHTYKYRLSFLIQIIQMKYKESVHDSLRRIPLRVCASCRYAYCICFHKHFFCDGGKQKQRASIFFYLAKRLFKKKLYGQLGKNEILSATIGQNRKKIYHYNL